jgi:DNA-binding response OmpR family regulator
LIGGSSLTMPTILVVEDDPDIRRLVVRVLRMTGYQVCQAEDGLDAQKQFVLRSPDLVLTDLHMPGLDGGALARWIEKQDTTPIVFMTAVDATWRDTDIVLEKPFALQALTATVESALRTRRHCHPDLPVGMLAASDGAADHGTP